MRIIKAIFSIVLALGLIACAALFVFLQVFDTDPYLSQIAKKASSFTGRQVSIGHLGLGISQRGFTVDAWPVIIADDPDFTTEPFISIDRVRVSLDLSALLLKREVHVTDILLQSPQIHLIRSQDGNMNIHSLGGQMRPLTINTANQILAVKQIPQAAAQAKTDTPPKQVPDWDIKSIQIEDGAISFIDQNQAVFLDIWLTGLNLTLRDFSLSKPFPISLEASFYSNTPNVQASTTLSLDLPKKEFSFSNLRLNVDSTPIDISRLKSISPQMSDNSILQNITGALALNIDQFGPGASGSLEAKGDVGITNGVIKHFNIIKTLLVTSLGNFGIMEGNINNLFTGQLKDTLGADDTIIEKAQAQFLFHDKTFFIDDLLLKTNIFELTAKGSIDQGLNVDMDTMLHLNEDVSTALVNKMDGLKLLYDDSQRVAIGASLTGTIPHLKYKPNKDFRKKSKRALIQEGGNLLGILLGGDQTSAPDQGQEVSAKDQAKKIKKGFKSIFRNFLQ